MSRTKTWLPLLAAAGLLSTASSAFAVLPTLSYNFSQTGYTGGATITGSFTGTDLDGNGLLVQFPSGPAAGNPNTHELTAWSAHFSGNALSPAFDLSFADLFGFVYQIGRPTLGDGLAHDPIINQDLIEGIGGFSSARFYTSGRGPNNNVPGGYIGATLNLASPATSALDSTPNLVQVTQVPEPASAMLAVAGLISVAAIKRRAHRQLFPKNLVQ